MSQQLMILKDSLHFHFVQKGEFFIQESLKSSHFLNEANENGHNRFNHSELSMIYHILLHQNHSLGGTILTSS
jgi:hypothetical protein